MEAGDDMYGSDDSFPASILQPPVEKIHASENPESSGDDLSKNLLILKSEYH